MSLESATYVNQLVVSNPDGSDVKGQGDDHLRLIKNTLKNTFPNLNAAVTVTPAEMNALAGGVNLVPIGFIGLWFGTVATIPTGWRLCNGTASTPDLRDRFVVGAGSVYAPFSTGGALNHTHTISVFGTALSVAQLPPHNHPAAPGQAFVTTGSGSGNTIGGSSIGSTVGTGITGQGEAHTHPSSATTVSHLPPYYALCYIMRAN